MPTIYRIVHERYRDDPFSGKGGLQHRSRWASRGQLVSYAADHLATVTLEKLAGIVRADLMTDMVYAKAEIESEQEGILAADELPEDWDALPASDATRVIGDTWLDAGSHVLLRVPSAVLPDSYYYVVDAAHPGMSDLKVVEVAPLLLDNQVLARIGAEEE